MAPSAATVSATHPAFTPVSSMTPQQTQQHARYLPPMPMPPTTTIDGSTNVKEEGML